jgi:SAM-dependent methyltransferase
MTEDYRNLLSDAILDEDTFISATFSGQQRGSNVEWQRIYIRPVLLRSRRHLQFTYFDGQRNLVKNYAGAEARTQVRTALALDFRNYHVLTTTGAIQVNMSKKGKALVSRGRRPNQPINVNLAHDREKQTILSPDSSASFLRAVGILTGDGRVKQKMQSKYRQINDFLRILEDTGAVDELPRPARAVDLGCGSAYLTFATYHYLSDLHGIPTRLTGVDQRADLLAKNVANAQMLGWSGLEFETAQIIDYEPDVPPQLVLALHACDTATDEALARAIAWNSRIVLAAPCCHHHLQEQLDAIETPEPFVPVLRHGILRERLGDVLTDSFRALILRIMGYRTDIVEFVDVEHTPKNIMIRAVRTAAQPGDPRFVAEYQAMKAYWGVTPYLETLLEPQLSALLAPVEG